MIDLCEWCEDFTTEGVEAIVTVNGYVSWVCRAHALDQCDPIGMRKNDAVK